MPDDTTTDWTIKQTQCTKCYKWYDWDRFVGELCIDCYLVDLKSEQRITWRREESRSYNPGGPDRAKQRPTPKARAPPGNTAIRVNHVGKSGNTQPSDRETR